MKQSQGLPGRAPLFEEVHERALSNGLRVLVAPQPHLHEASFAMFVRVGSRYETPQTNGLSHFLEHMMFRGTASMPTAYDLNVAIESIGGSMNGATQADATMFTLALPPESVAEGLRVFGEMFRSPRFDALEVEKDIVREEILEGIDEDGASVDVDDASRALLFDPHALGLKITGDADNVDTFTKDDLERHRATYYGASNMVFVGAGAVDPEEVCRAAEEAFGDLPRGAPATSPPPDVSATGPRTRFVEGSSAQTELRLSFVAFGEHDPRATALEALLRVLDDGMSARLHRRICDEKGLAYDVFANLDLYPDCGILDFGASVDHSKVVAITREMLELCSELTRAEVSPAELEKVKRRYRFGLRSMKDAPQSLTEFLGFSWLSGATLSLDARIEAMDKVTARDVRVVAAEVFRKERVAFTAVGNLDESEKKALVAALETAL